MSDLLDGSHTCSICKKQHDHCFHIEYSSKHEFSDDDERIGCYDCLKRGEFEFWHDSEFGLLDENGLNKLYDHNSDNPPKLSIDVINEMRRTPQIVTYQQELWLTHCDDFMVYKGTWEPLDFYKNSPTHDGRELFMAMTNEEWNHLWDESLEAGQKLLNSWHATYYVFECRHCRKLRGNWDCD